VLRDPAPCCARPKWTRANNLTPSQRDAIWTLAKSGTKAAEIGQLLKVRPHTVTMCLSRRRQRDDPDAPEEPAKRARGRPSSVQEGHRQLLWAVATTVPDVTLEELRQVLQLGCALPETRAAGVSCRATARPPPMSMPTHHQPTAHLPCACTLHSPTPTCPPPYPIALTPAPDDAPSPPRTPLPPAPPTNRYCPQAGQACPRLPSGSHQAQASNTPP
jgi:transposase